MQVQSSVGGGQARPYPIWCPLVLGRQRVALVRHPRHWGAGCARRQQHLSWATVTS